MFDPIFEGRPSIYFLIAAIGACCLVGWYRNQQKKWLLRGVWMALAAAALYAVLDWAVETGREEAQRKVTEMAAAVSRQDFDAAFRFVSDRFMSPAGRNKAALRRLADEHRNSGEVTRAAVWDFQVLDRFDPANKPARMSFLLKVDGNYGPQMAHCVASFEHNGVDGWQIRGLELFDVFNQSQPFPFRF